MRVAVVGAGGRMGVEVCRAVAADPGFELVSLVDPGLKGRDPSELIGPAAASLGPLETVDELDPKGVDAVVDFTVADVAVRTMRWCAAHAVHAVVGTTGIADDVLTEMHDLFASAPSNCVVAANFAVGAVLMMKFAELAAPHMDDAEIVELHHDRKLDAPSGTAIASAKRMAEARLVHGVGPWPPDRTVKETLPGSRGAAGPGGLRVHSVRIPGLVAHQEVILGAAGQSLTIRHDAYERTSFMPGVLLALRSVPNLEGLTIGLDSVLGL